MLLQLGGSLVAILALAGIARALKLGPPPEIADSPDAMRLAREADSGFDPAQAAVSRDGAGAILADGEGRMMVLRRHGSHFAGRLLEPGARATIDGAILRIALADPRFGPATLDLGDDARAWAARVEALQGQGNA